MHELIWKNCLEYIKERIPNQSYNTWFKPITPLKSEGNVLTIQVPSQFFYEWLEEHYVHTIKDAISKEMGPGGRLEYSVVMQDDAKANGKSTALKVKNLADRKQANNISDNSDFVEDLDSVNSLNPTYTFNSFIEGDCNRLGRSAGYAVAKKPGITSFNPLMIYGGVGLGKTHLMQAVGNEILNSKPDARVVYLHSQRFVQDMVKALQQGTIDTVNRQKPAQPFARQLAWRRQQPFCNRQEPPAHDQEKGEAALWPAQVQKVAESTAFGAPQEDTQEARGKGHQGRSGAVTAP